MAASILLLAASLLSREVNSFAHPSAFVHSCSFVGHSHEHQPATNFFGIETENEFFPNHVSSPKTRLGTTRLDAALLSNLPSVLSKISPPVRNSLILGSAAVAIYKNRGKLFYPGTSPDPAFSEPLPPGSLGCPLLGNLGFFTKNGSVENGPGQFFKIRAEATSSPSIFKYMLFSKPITMLSGMKNVKAAFNTEFKKINCGILFKGFSKLFGEASLFSVTDAGRHNYLRKLLGQAMTPEAIEKAMPALVRGATAQIDSLASQSNVVMEDVCTNFTLDVAWRQILGLDLKNDEIGTFNTMVNDWVGGITDLRVMVLPGVEKTKAGKAKEYLVSVIERRIDELNTNGPDSSTLSSMVFARDEEDESKRLTPEEIISNSLLLILAGSETAASTLTVATLALGLHKDVFHKLKEEQNVFVSKNGSDLTNRDLLEKECPYLDAVIKETMRIKPLSGTGAPRFARETLVVDGKQIPKGFGVVFNIYLTHANDPAVKTDDNSHMDITKGFHPERWLNEKTKPKEFMPFGYGPRFCLGANLAMAEMKVFLSLFARRVDYDLVNMKPDNVTWKKASIIPKPSDGTLISVLSLVH